MSGIFVLKPVLGSQLNQGHPLSKGLVGFWLFNEGSGYIAHDLSGNSKTGTLTGTTPAWVAGDYGPAIDLPGTDERIEIVPTSQIVAKSPLSILIRAKCNVSSPSFEGLLSIHDGSNNVVVAYYNNGDNGFVCRFDAYDSAAVRPTSAIDETVWHDFVMTFDGTTTLIYMDGVQLATEGGTDLSPPLDGLGIKIGRGFSTSYYGDVQVSCCMMWDYVLIASGIALLYREPFCMLEKDPVELWVGATSVGAPPVGAAGIMTPNTGFWGPTF